MLSFIFLVTSALSSGMSSPYTQQGLKSVHDAPASVSNSLYYISPGEDENSISWDDEIQRNNAMFERLGNKVKRIHTGEQMSLSIVNPLDVLRQKLLLELSNRQFRQKQDQINANYNYLKKIG